MPLLPNASTQLFTSASFLQYTTSYWFCAAASPRFTQYPQRPFSGGMAMFCCFIMVCSRLREQASTLYALFTTIAPCCCLSFNMANVRGKRAMDKKMSAVCWAVSACSSSMDISPIGSRFITACKMALSASTELGENLSSRLMANILLI